MHFAEAVPGTGIGDFKTALACGLKLYLHETCPNIRKAAELTGISDRTLKRHLSKPGLNFRAMYAL